MVATQSALRCEHLIKTYGSTRAVDGLDIDLERGHVLALLGPSGCGKTTALRVIAGFEAPDSGVVHIGGVTVSAPGVNLPPEKRHVGFVFQDYALFPHMNVARNVAFGLPRHRPRGRLQELLWLVGLEQLQDRMPHQLSGGQQQRVALARTLASEPDVLLLDEPFSNLDVRLRIQVREEVQRVIQATGMTTVFVTHDQDEAFTMADQIIVMNRGRVEQVGRAEELYHRPATRFVAGFVGLANFLPATVDHGVVRCELGRWVSDWQGPRDVDVLVRPDSLVLGEGEVTATVVASEFHGHERLHTLQLPSGTVVRVSQPSNTRIEVGGAVRVSLCHTATPVLFAGEHDRDHAAVAEHELVAAM